MLEQVSKNDLILAADSHCETFIEGSHTDAFLAIIMRITSGMERHLYSQQQLVFLPWLAAQPLHNRLHKEATAKQTSPGPEPNSTD